MLLDAMGIYGVIYVHVRDQKTILRDIREMDKHLGGN